MTDDEIRKALDAHPGWSKRRKLAFVEANLEIDIEAEIRRRAHEVIDTAVRDGLLIVTDDGKVRATGEIGPADARGLAVIAKQHWRQKREALERIAVSGSPLERAKAKTQLAEMEIPGHCEVGDNDRAV